MTMVKAATLGAHTSVETRPVADFVRRLRALAVPSLARMYRPEERTFVFRLRLTPGGIAAEGTSKRYTAITLIGLANEDEALVETVLAGTDRRVVCENLVRDVGTNDNLGDVALLLWAARAVGYDDVEPIRKRLFALQPREKNYPVVEVAWALAALCEDRHSSNDALRDVLAARLVSAFAPHSAVFPHMLGEGTAGLRSHVACFADLVYPVHALARYAKLTQDKTAVDVARQCANLFCRKQGPGGQWWWHYDWRTGDVIEPYPVYAVHQDSMAPMALFALEEATGAKFGSYIEKGLAWLARAPELGGGSLVDDDVWMIWRKVARREPRKMTRTLQALISRFHPRLRAPGVDVVFPVGAVDYEDRPYHLGWLLYAWPFSRIARWEG